MKRGKDEDKSMGPMFPRLHVNDTEKGGPRAPPRNKMALYEQLSIPSQRFNPSPAVNYHKSAANFVPPSSSGQANGNERGNHFSPQLPPAEKACTRYNDSNYSSAQLEQRKKADEDDFSVPVFVQSNMGQENNNSNNNNNNNNSYNNNNNGNNNKNSTVTDGHKLSPFSPPYSVQKPSRNECTNTNCYVRSQSTGDSLQRGYRVESQAGNSRNSLVPVRDVQVENERNLDDANGDDISESSMLDSISGIDISPDDVVGIIGQKHFWKARRAIVNQQRVFAVQVFELHRLMKVQRLIAGSPHLLLEDGSYLGQPIKPAPAKKLPIEYIVKPKIIEQKVISSEKTNQTTEYSAENAVAKASLSSVQNNSQPSNYPPPFSGNPPPSSGGSWGFNQPPGHQWLIPVMSPSEGLVYKPYPGPGFMNTGGGYGTPPPAQPVMGNFINYGGPPPPHHHYQGLGLPQFTPPPGHGYFPPFGMPVMNPSVEQGHNGQFSGGGSTFNVPYQGSSCNVPSQKNRDGQGQGQFSTASSQSEQQVAPPQPPPLLPPQAAANGLSLFPTSPVAQVPDGGEAEEQRAGRLIKVVPHNARSATESVARIFQSIQDERKQFDSV